MSLSLINPVTTSCNCNIDSINITLDRIESELIFKGDKLFLSQSYEVGNSPTELEMFNLLSQKDAIDSNLNRICKFGSSYVHTEETYLEKYCHEDDL